jgi:rubrerythrin
MHSHTQEHLATSMRAEAFAYAKYRLFAQHARAAGQLDLAVLFEETARTELLEHFAEEANLAGLVGGDDANLRDAIAGESGEVDAMYRQFAEDAATEGDIAAATRFAEVRVDEMRHRDAFTAALARLQTAEAAR